MVYRVIVGGLFDVVSICWGVGNLDGVVGGSFG